VLVEVCQRGGFAGLTRRGSFDTATLPSEQATPADEALRRLLETPAVAAPQPDRFVYELTIHDGAATRDVEVNERDVPAALQPLLAAAIQRGEISG